MTTHPLTYVEIDIDYCSRTFGVAPCTAVGSDKCFNTRNRSHDCGDPANYSAATKTLRFGVDSGFLPPTIDCIPSLVSAEISPARIDAGETIGQRATLTAKFKNHKHNDIGLDKNIISRSYDAYETGTFWGKFFSRNPYLFRMPLRVLQGYLGDDIADFTTYHFVIERFDGPDTDGEVTIGGVDFLRYMDGESAQIPAVSIGALNANITDVASSATLKPSGVGNASYPASGTAIIGDEIVTFTRAGDVLTLTRATNGTVAAAHEADDTFQICFVQTSQTESQVLYNMITGYSDLPASYITQADWDSECAEYSGLLYTGIIPKPMDVKKAVEEFIKQAGIILYPDIVAQKLRLNFIRPVPVTAPELNDSNCFSGLSVKDSGKRFSQVWTYFNQKNKALELEKDENYKTIYAKIDSDNPHEVESIKKIYSRWLPPAATSAAANISGRTLARYRVAPRQFMRKVPRGASYSLGQSVNLTSWVLEDAFGSPEIVPCQIIGIRYNFDSVELTLEELRFAEDLLTTDRIFIYSENTKNINLRSVHDSVYASITGTPVIRFIINSSVIIGSSTTSAYAIESGTWPGGVVPEIENHGFIVGRGGNAGQGMGALNGSPGGPAIHVTSAISIDNTGATIGGGGGGGGSAWYTGGTPNYLVGAGGGAGGDVGYGVSGASYIVGSSAGTTTTGGAAGAAGAGAGGNLGATGANATGGTMGGTGGAAGVAVQGDSLVTWVALGTVSGARTG